VLATLGYGINTNLVGRYMSQLPALFIGVWSFSLVGIPALLYLLTTDFVARAALPQNGPPLLALCALGGLGSGLMSVFFNRVVQIASPLFAASVTYLIPVVALAWGLLNAEAIYAVQYLGMAVCLLGVYLINRK
jgi:drug/metabolite transporter (DMT)-like permease